MRKILSSLSAVIIAAACLTSGLTSSAAYVGELVSDNTVNASADPALDAAIRDKILELKEQYPEGTPWTNENHYSWKGGVYSTGFGCAGFAFMLSDYVYGSDPAVKHTNFSDIRVGDLLRMNGDTHTVVILALDGNKATIAEGNYNKSVHWGRVIDLSDSSRLTYVMTRRLYKGDADNSSTVDSGDASLALAEYSAISTGSPSVLDSVARWKADIDGSGSVDSVDASLILAYYAYISTGGASSGLNITDWMKSGKNN